jgi:DNA polymerase
MSAPICSIDFETACVESIEDCGAAAYTRHPTFVVTTMAWAFGDGPVYSQQKPTHLPTPVYEHIRAGGTIRCWNAEFEVNVIENFFDVPIVPDQVDDTQARAMYFALPAGLGDAGDALRLGILKDKKARALMLQMARPRVNKGGVLRWWHDEDQAKLDALTDYCVADVEAERAIANALPPLPDSEQDIYRATLVINQRGIKFDMALVRKMQGLAEEAVSDVNARAAEISGGEITSPGTQHGRMAAFFAGTGINSFAKGVLPDLLKREDLSPAQREMLELRALSAKSSTAKLAAVEHYADGDGVVRGTLKYYGAHSGRYSSKGPQIQNLPRGSVKKPEAAIDSILQGMDAHGLSLFYGAPMEVLSSCIRGTIIPRPGNVFVGYDFAQIEARITAFGCGQDDLVEVFRRGEDVYSFTSDKLGLGSRQAGKATVLGLGFQLGHKRFIEFAATYGLNLTVEESEEIVRAWRDANSKIRNTWYALDDAAREVIKLAKMSGVGVATRKVNEFFTFAVRPAKNGSPTLMLKIPGGRVLFYRDARIVEMEEFGKTREVILCSGLNKDTKQYEIAEFDDEKQRWRGNKLYGGKFLENAVQGWAASCMINSMLEIERQGLGEVVMSIHDEIVAEVPEHLAQERFEQIGALMRETPDWCAGLPLAAEGDIMRRFKK